MLETSDFWRRALLLWTWRSQHFNAEGPPAVRKWGLVTFQTRGLFLLGEPRVKLPGFAVPLFQKVSLTPEQGGHAAAAEGRPAKHHELPPPGRLR